MAVRIVVLLAAAALAIATPAGALTLLTADKLGIFRSGAGREPAALVRLAHERAFATPPDPTCPAASSLRFALSRRGADFEDHGEAALPCERWRRTRGGYRYDGSADDAGGVREILIGRRRLVVRAGGPGFRSVAGPVAYVEAFLTIAGERHIVRFQNFRRNDAERLLSRRPSVQAWAGEATFWDTLWADSPRQDVALKLLQAAVKRDRRDGRSHFLLGMLRLYRSTIACAEFDFMNLCDAAIAEGVAAQEPLDRAVELLPNDTRIAGFRAAATYANGYVLHDPGRLALGLARIDDTVATNPLFNSFDLFAVVAPVTPGGSAYYQERILPLVDFVLQGDPGCIFTIPEICNNAGMAPHNFEGTLLLLGDIYAKGGRLADAEFWYGLGQTVGASSGYRYQAVLDERVATAAARVALYQDADPANDPPLVGGGGASCVYCHNK